MNNGIQFKSALPSDTNTLLKSFSQFCTDLLVPQLWQGFRQGLLWQVGWQLWCCLPWLALRNLVQRSIAPALPKCCSLWKKQPGEKERLLSNSEWERALSGGLCLLHCLGSWRGPEQRETMHWVLLGDRQSPFPTYHMITCSKSPPPDFTNNSHFCSFVS